MALVAGGSSVTRFRIRRRCRLAPLAPRVSCGGSQETSDRRQGDLLDPLVVATDRTGTLWAARWTRWLALGALLVSACEGGFRGVIVVNSPGPQRGSMGSSDTGQEVDSGGVSRQDGPAGPDAGGTEDSATDSVQVVDEPPPVEAVDGGSVPDGPGDSAFDGSPLVDGTDAPIEAGNCPGGTSDLSNIGSGDFNISFHIVTSQTGLVALLNQRKSCDYGVFWDIRQSMLGMILVELDSGSSYKTLKSTGLVINDGNPHDVTVARASGKLTIQIDGVVTGESTSSESLGVLPPLRVGKHVCVSTVPFAGTLSEVCIKPE